MLDMQVCRVGTLPHPQRYDLHLLPCHLLCLHGSPRTHNDGGVCSDEEVHSSPPRQSHPPHPWGCHSLSTKIQKLMNNMTN